MLNIPKPHYASDEDHSQYSPSGAKRWMGCPASIQFLRNIKRVPSKPNRYAEEGTAAHELAAYCLENETSPRACLGKIFNNFKVDLEMAKEVAKYVDYINATVAWDSTLWVENRLSMSNIHPDMFGTADAIIVSDDYMEVVDLKYGQGVPVEVEDNYQLSLYAIGALLHLHKHGVTYEDDFEVKLTIAQPRAPHAHGPIRSTTVTVAQLRDLSHRAKEILAVAERSDAPFGPSESNCRWCEGAPTCHALAQYNLKLAQLEFADLVKTPLQFKQKLPIVEEMTKEDLANVLKHSKALENWLNAVAEKAINMAKADDAIPGYKLVYGRSNRAWKDQEQVESILLENLQDPERIYEKKFLSPTKAEKELSDWEWELVKDLVYKPTGKITLAPESDKRPSVDPHMAAADDWSQEEDI
jgi:hypothetical protein